ncbi:mannitol dehydrogenase family protein [Catenovulum sediminis]|uniref:Mannitol dehydrogenase family protein n=1 Tax=Catenovulum sediminis TaxID=1740262 RepID=A0ABV1RC62_9ALTE
MNNIKQSHIEFPRLKQNLLPQLPADIDVPTYDRTQLKAGIVHIGVGGFHRAHQAVYTNELLKIAGNEQWGICGVGLFENNRGLSEILAAQDYLYTVIVRHPNGEIEHKIVGSMIDFLLAPDDKQKVIDKLAHPDTKIVSLTITEGGYNINPATGEFNSQSADIVHDINQPTDPKTTFGFLTAALKQRKEAGLPAFTVMSCDNIQHNGDMTKKMLLAFIELTDSELATWVNEQVCFPNSMVDRITPQTTAVELNHVEQQLGFSDQWPITCEPFTQWVIEDNFSQGCPKWQLADEKTGAQFVDNVAPYEKMKLRLLNAGHSVLGILGAVEGFSTINECVQDPVFKQFLRVYLDKEATPTLDEVKGVDLEAYKNDLIERFANPNIKDSVSRICSESSAKIPKFILETASQNLAAQRDVRLAALLIAAWCWYSDRQVDRYGQAINIQDEMQKSLHLNAAKTPQDNLAFIRQADLFGDLINNKAFVNAYIKAVHHIYATATQSGIKPIMLNYLTEKE